MSTPDGGNAFEHQLELVVRAELTLAETSQSEVQVDGVPAVEWPPDPEAQRYETYLHTLLGAVEALEDDPGAGDPSPQAQTEQEAYPLGDGRD